MFQGAEVDWEIMAIAASRESTDNQTVLELRGIKKGFELPRGGKREVLDIEHFVFPSRGLFAICGPSGEGKTTLLNLIGLLDVLDEGEILIDGKDISAFRGKKENQYRHAHIGYMRQTADLLPYLNVLQNATVSFAISTPFSKKEQEKQRARELLERFGILEREADYPATLSGGEKARVALARALAMDPEMLLCDEPTGSLSEEEAEGVMQYLEDLGKSKLVLVVSHDGRLMQRHCAAVLHLEKGHLLGSIPEAVGEEGRNGNAKILHHRPLRVASLAFCHLERHFGRFALAGLIGALGVFGTAVSYSIHKGTDVLGNDFSNSVKARLPLSVSQLFVGELNLGNDNVPNYPTEPYVVPLKETRSSIHINIIDETFLDYLAANLPKDSYALHYEATAAAITEVSEGNYKVLSAGNGEYGGIDLSFISTFIGETPLIQPCEISSSALIESNDLLYGEYPTRPEDMFLVVGRENTLDSRVLSLLGFDGAQKVAFQDLVGKEFKFVPNETIYKKRAISQMVTGRFLKPLETFASEGRSIPKMVSDYLEGATRYNEGDLEGATEAMNRFRECFGEEETRELFAYSPLASQSALLGIYADEQIGTKVRVTGILRVKENVIVNPLDGGLYYSQPLAQQLRQQNGQASIAEELHSHLLLNGSVGSFPIPEVYSIFDKVEKQTGGSVMDMVGPLVTYYQNRSALALPDGPTRISFNTNDGAMRDKILNVLNAYNQGKSEYQKIEYSDYGEQLADLISGYGDVFSRSAFYIFLVVALSNLLIMVLFASVQTKGRTREIGLYRYLGMGRGKVISVFASEGLFQGIFSGALGLTLGIAFVYWFNGFVRDSASFAAVRIAILQPLDGFVIALIAVMTGLLASLAVALFHAVIRPSETMREE